MSKNKCTTIATFDYLRKSTKGEEKDSNGQKRERQEKSIGQQRAELDKMGLPREVADAGYERIKIEGTFTDEGVSGWKMGKNKQGKNKRPGFAAMIEAIQQHPATEKLIRVDDIDRFSRADMDETQEVARTLKQAGVRWIVSAAQGVFHLGRSGNDIGEAIKFIIAAWSAHESSRKTGRRVCLARRNQAAAGKRPSAPRLYGMKTDDKGGLVLGDPDQVATVRWIFDQFVKRGKSLRWIALELNKNGTPAPKGKIWYVETIKGLLQQKAYCGDFSYGERPGGQFYRTGADGEVVEAEDWEDTGKPAFLHKGIFEAIIDRPTWDAAQARLASFKTGRKPRHDSYVLSRLVVCDHCGQPMYGVINGGRTVYRCGSEVRQGKCKQWQVREDRILPAIMGMLSEEIDELAAKALTPAPPEPAPASAADERIGSLAERIRTAEDRILDVKDKRTRQALDQKITEWRDELERLEAEQEQPFGDVGAAAQQLKEWWQEFIGGLVRCEIDANSQLAKGVAPEVAAEAAKPAPWDSWKQILCPDASTVFLAQFDRRQLNEALHALGCEVRLRFTTEQHGQRPRHVLDRARIRLGQQAKDVIGSVNLGFPCMSYKPQAFGFLSPTGCVLSPLF